MKKEKFFVSGLNFTICVPVDTDVFDGNSAYYEAATMAFEQLYKTEYNNPEIELVSLVDANTEEDIVLNSKINIDDWKTNLELVLPDWGHFLCVKKMGTCNEMFVSTKKVVDNTSVLPLIEELNNIMKEEVLDKEKEKRKMVNSQENEEKKKIRSKKKE